MSCNTGEVLAVFAAMMAGLLSPLPTRGRLVLVHFASGLFLSVNRPIYAWAVGGGRTVGASMGYFINPCFGGLLGVVVLGEPLRPAQIAAVILATGGWS